LVLSAVQSVMHHDPPDRTVVALDRFAPRSAHAVVTLGVVFDLSHRWSHRVFTDAGPFEREAGEVAGTANHRSSLLELAFQRSR
jgi:hypothetical protein